MILGFFNQNDFVVGCQGKIENGQQFLKPQAASVSFNPSAISFPKLQFNQSRRRMNIRWTCDEHFKFITSRNLIKGEADGIKLLPQ